MMTIFPVANHQRWVNGYNLNITARLINPAEIGMMTVLEVHTTRIYVYLTKLIEAGATEVPDERNLSAETAINPDYKWDAFSENRITVFCWNKKIELTLHSCDEPQQVLNLYYADKAAKAELDMLYPSEPQNAQKSNVAPSNSSAAHETPVTPQAPVNGVISAVRAPNPNEPQYADGQLVSFQINKVAVGSNKGSATFALWGSLGQKYPLVTIYKYKPDGTSLKPDYLKSKDVLEGLGLSFDKTEATGNWFLVCRVAHAKGKEYFNVHSFEAVQS